MASPAALLTRFLLSSDRPYAQILSSTDAHLPSMRGEADFILGVYTLVWQRTSGNHMQSVRKLAIRLPQNLGELVRVTPPI